MSHTRTSTREANSTASAMFAATPMRSRSSASSISRASEARTTAWSSTRPTRIDFEVFDFRICPLPCLRRVTRRSCRETTYRASRGIPQSVSAAGDSGDLPVEDRPDLVEPGCEPVDVFGRRVDAEARACGGGEIEALVERHRAVVTGTHRDAETVEHLRDVMGVDLRQI